VRGFRAYEDANQNYCIILENAEISRMDSVLIRRDEHHGPHFGSSAEILHAQHPAACIENVDVPKCSLIRTYRRKLTAPWAHCSEPDVIVGHLGYGEEQWPWPVRQLGLLPRFKNVHIYARKSRERRRIVDLHAGEIE